MKRYGIFGGAFNPPHIAHSIIAEDVRQQLHLDRIIFIPTGNPPLKNNDDIPSAEIRLEMAKLAFGSDPNFEVNDIEAVKPAESGKTYTIDTMRYLYNLYKNDSVKLHLIIGIDNLIDFPKWKDPHKLFALSEVIVMNRPGYLVQDAKPEFSEKVRFINIPMLEVSSTRIREMVKKGMSIKYLVTPGVEEYIVKNNLYK